MFRLGPTNNYKYIMNFTEIVKSIALFILKSIALFIFKYITLFIFKYNALFIFKYIVLFIFKSIVLFAALIITFTWQHLLRYKMSHLSEYNFIDVNVCVCRAALLFVCMALFLLGVVFGAITDTGNISVNIHINTSWV